MSIWALILLTLQYIVVIVLSEYHYCGQSQNDLLFIELLLIFWFIVDLINLESLNLDSCKIGDEGMLNLKGKCHDFLLIQVVTCIYYQQEMVSWNSDFWTFLLYENIWTSPYNFVVVFQCTSGIWEFIWLNYTFFLFS